jgi:PTH2 family peptidyl-tRNA hydrolase
MGKGKIAAQCCHAAVACVSRARKADKLAVRQWNWYGAAKIALKVLVQLTATHSARR